MFNLNEAIAAWRREMAAQHITSADVLDELECHLRDDVEQQVCAGTDVEAAFNSATQRIGSAAVLGQEFAKSGQPKVTWPRSFWRNFYYCSAAVAVFADLWTLVSFELSLLERLLGACAIAGFAWYLFRLPYLSWWSAGAARTRFLSVVKATGILVVLWTLWALLFALQLVHVQIGIVPEMIMWSLCAAYGLTGLACGLNNPQGSGGSGTWPTPIFPAPGPVPPERPWPSDFNIPVPPAAFTSVSGKALDLAREEALRLGHDFIGTEHLLLGVLRIAGGTLAPVLERCCHVDTDSVRQEIERLVSGLPAHPPRTVLQLTPRARKALQFAGMEAASLKRPLINPEHVLLGLLIEGRGVAALALKNLGVRLKCMRAEFSAIRGNDESST